MVETIVNHSVENDATASQLKRQRIEFLSFLFACLVVSSHCAWEASSVLGQLLIFMIPKTLGRALTVPFFFACSGYFIARHFDECGWWRHELGKRVFSLGVPYVLWTAALALVLFVNTREVMGIGGLGIDFCKLPALAPLWYVRCLMLFVLTLPVWKLILDFGKGGLLVGVYFLSLFVDVTISRFGLSDVDGLGGFIIHGYSVSGLFFFLSGVYMCRYGAPSISKRQSVVLLGLGLVFLAGKLFFDMRNVFVGINMIQLIAAPLLAGLWGVVKVFPMPRWLVGCAFPIYVMHAVVILGMRSFEGVYHLCNPWLELILGIVVPIFFYHLIRRYARRLSTFLFGGR